MPRKKKPAIEVVDHTDTTTQDATQEPEERPGDLIALALVGPHADVFEIRRLERGPRRIVDINYYVNGFLVDPPVYRDCLTTAAANQYCPDCDAGVAAEPEPAPPS
jgi:hypothetical protein